jgi:hypothetical protein
VLPCSPILLSLLSIPPLLSLTNGEDSAVWLRGGRTTATQEVLLVSIFSIVGRGVRFDYICVHIRFSICEIESYVRLNHGRLHLTRHGGKNMAEILSLYYY